MCTTAGKLACALAPEEDSYIEMAAPKIKKKGSSSKASPLPRQGAIPCLILIAVLLIILGLILFFSLRTTGQ